MIDVFDYKVEDLIKFKKRNLVLGFSFLAIGIIVSVILLLVHNRSNSVVLCSISLFLIFACSFVGLFFILIKNGCVSKIIEIVKKKKTTVCGEYVVSKCDSEYFSYQGLTFKKIFVIDKEKNELVFYLLKGYEIEEKSKVSINSFNSIIIQYKIL